MDFTNIGESRNSRLHHVESPRMPDRTDYCAAATSRPTTVARDAEDAVTRLVNENSLLHAQVHARDLEIARLRQASARDQTTAATTTPPAEHAPAPAPATRNARAAGKTTHQNEKSKRTTTRSAGPKYLREPPAAASTHFGLNLSHKGGPPNDGYLVSDRAAAGADQKPSYKARLHARICAWRGDYVNVKGKQGSCFRCRKGHEPCVFLENAPCGCCKHCSEVDCKGGPNPGMWKMIPCRATSVVDLCEELVLCCDTGVSPHRLLSMASFQDDLQRPRYSTHTRVLDDILGGQGLVELSWWIPSMTQEFGKSLLPTVIRQGYDFESRQNVGSPLVLIALLCLRACQACLAGDSHLLSHVGMCEGPTCEIQRVQDLSTCLAMYLKELDVMLRDAKSLNNVKFLSITYSLFIMAYVQRALQIMEDRYLRPERPNHGASKGYFDRIIALFGAIEKEDTLAGEKKMSPKTFVEKLRRKSESGSDRGNARGLLAKTWAGLGIHTTCQFLQRHFRSICDAELMVPESNIGHRMDQHIMSPVFGADMDTFSMLAPSLTEAPTCLSGMTSPFQSPLVAAHNMSQASFDAMDLSLDLTSATHHEMVIDVHPGQLVSLGYEGGFEDMVQKEILDAAGEIDDPYNWNDESLPWPGHWAGPGNNA